MPEETPYGKRLLLTRFDELALERPDHSWAWVPRTADLRDGFRAVSYSLLCNAINRLAWWLELSLGKGQNFETLAYIGPALDVRYVILSLAGVKAGYKLLLISPRNSVEGNLSLFENTDCNVLIHPSNLHFRHLLEHRQMRELIIPEVADILDESKVPHHPYEKTYEDAKTEPVVVLHTSGSTGLPKPIVIKNAIYGSYDAINLLGLVDGKELYIKDWFGHRIFSVFPLFHSAGFLTATAAAAYMEVTMVLAPVGKPPDVDTCVQAFEQVELHGAFLPPAIVESMAKSPSSLKRLHKLKFLVFGGGPLSQEAAQMINTETLLYSTMGATETFYLPNVRTDPEDYQYFHFAPSTGVAFRQHTEDLHELFIVRYEKEPFFQGIFWTFPDLQEYSMKDLYSKHPTKPDLWMYRGRSDDVIVLSNGEKVQPVDIEGIMGTHPDVLSALVVGQGKFQPALLVELREASPLWEKSQEEKINAMWSKVEASTHDAPSHAKISKQFIWFTPAAKPMLRASKGTVQRQATTKLFKGEIEALYEAAESGINDADVKLDAHDEPSLKASLRTIISNVTSFEVIEEEADLFTLGMDSLHVLAIRRALKKGLQGQLEESSTRLVYQNPSVEKLTNAIWALLHPEQAAKHDQDVQDERRTQTMKAILEKYSAHLPIPHPTPAPSPTGLLTVILTGSTGSLGSYLLDTLLNDSRVDKIYCLNRSADAREKQIQVSSSRGLPTKWDAARVSFLHTNFAKPQMGLGQDDYQHLLGTVTHIIHNAWQVDFNMPVGSFESVHIAGVRRLIDFSAVSRHRSRIFFVSSVSTVMNWFALHPGVDVPEEIIHDFAVPEAMGYGESKHLAERLLDQAGAVSNVHSVICRVGQVAGPVLRKQGKWSPQEWLPSILASSKFLNAVPDALPAGLGAVDWIPVDLLATIIVELMLPDDSSSSSALSSPVSTTTMTAPTQVTHAVNPQLTSWTALLPTVTKYLSASSHTKPIATVSFGQWLDKLRASAPTTTDDVAVRQNPGVKLLDFYTAAYAGADADAEHRTARLSTAGSVVRSPTLGGLQAVNEAWMERWLEQWAF
ncbi:MAG: hypothetical protein M1819_001967 [Sarea resinae]|nr:MAG: hypothetical protein M1819_001967 [Sarea resinae]